MTIVLLGTGCNTENCDPPNEVGIRIENSSIHDYTDVHVNTGGGEQDYGDLASGQFSDHRIFNFAYSYAFVQLGINGDTLTIQPIDYVGETKLDCGNYTYRIGVDQAGSLSIALIED